MPAVVDPPKPASKSEEFVEKQIESARKRIRSLDWFSTGLVLLIGGLVSVLAVLLIDRYVEMPSWTPWVALGGYLFVAAGFVYGLLYRPSRRQINPYYAARSVEMSIADAKNSVINYVDLKDDAKIPGSVKASIGARAAKDLKHVDLNRVLQKKQILWLAGAAGILFLASLVVAFLPPTRTTLALVAPEKGNTEVTQGEELAIRVQLKGRIPEKTDPDAPKLRLWYNPDDPGSFEERPLEKVDNGDGKKNVFGVTIPAKQVRNGFRWKVVAGKVQTDEYEVKLRIIPQFTGWEVKYQYPEYLGRKNETTNDPNIVGYYGTTITLTAFANRPVKSATIEIDGQLETIAGQVLEDNPEAVRFVFNMQKTSRYRIRFVTTSNHTNPDPPRYRLTLLDPKPLFLNYDVTYDYPAYLRYKPVSVNVREPNLEAMRGTKIALVAHANRPVKEARIQFPGVEQPILGAVVDKKPMQVMFSLPPLMKDGTYRAAFTPKTDEGEVAQTFTIRVFSDEKPKVGINLPLQQEVELPVNGVLAVEGFADDDIGIEKMNLRMEVISPAPSKPLAPKAYRGGISFLRKEDNSYPTHIDYKDFVELAKVRPEGDAGNNFKLQPGMVVEYWLEAIDNCDVPPGPNSGMSNKMRVRIMPAEVNEKKQQEQNQARKDLEKDQQKHEQKQDQQNAAEKREPKQPQPNNEQPPPKQGKADDQQPKKGEPKQDGMQPMKGEPMMGENNMADPNMADPNMPDPDFEKKQKELNDALKKNNPMNNMAEPKMNDPKMGEMGEPKDMKQDGMGPESDPNQLQKPEDLQKLAEKLQSKDEKEREQAKEQLKQMMEQSKKEPPKKGEPKKADDHRNMLPEEEKQKFDEAMKKIQEEMKNINREERVKDAAERAQSDDPETRKKGQEDLERELQNQNSRDDVDRQLQNLAGDQQDKTKKQRLEDAMDLSRDNLLKKEKDPMNKPKMNDTAKDPPPMPKPEKKKEDVDELAKKMQKGKPEEKKEAQDELKKKLKDPMQREQVQKQLDDIKNKLPEGQEKKDFEQAVDEMKKNQQAAEDVQKFANQLKSDNPAERQNAQKQLEQAMKQADKDPQTRDEAKKDLEKIRDSIKDDKKKQEFDQAMKDIDKSVQKQRQEQQAAADKQRKEDVQNLTKDLNSKDKPTQEKAQQKLEEMLKDPANKQAVKDELDKQKAENPGAKDAIEKAVEKAENNLAKKEPPKKGEGGKVDPKQVEQMAKDLNSKDKGTQEAAQQKLEEMLKDPANKQAVKDELDKQKAENPGAKDAIEQAVKQAEQNLAKKESGTKGGKIDPNELDRALKQMQSNDPKQVEEGVKKFQDQVKQDPAQKAEMEKELAELLKDKQRFEEYKKAVQNVNEKMKVREETDKLADQLKKGNDDAQNQSREELKKMLDDPLKREFVRDGLERFKDNLSTPEERKDFEKKLQQLRDQLAKQGGKEPGKDWDIPKVLAKNSDKESRDAALNEMRKKVQSGELLLEQFKKNISSEEFKKQLGWTDEEIAKFQKKYEQQVEQLKNQLDLSEKNELPMPRVKGPSILDNQGPRKVDLDPRDIGDPTRGGRGIAPPGFEEAYKRFTQELSGVPTTPAPKK